MKIQYKLLLMLILFFGITIFNSQDCFAVFESAENIPKDIPCYDYFSERFPTYASNFVIFSLDERKLGLDGNFYLLVYLVPKSLDKDYDFYFRFEAPAGTQSWISTNANTEVGINIVACRVVDDKTYNSINSGVMNRIELEQQFSFYPTPFFEKLKVYYSTSDVYMNLNSAEEDSIFYSPPVNVDKLNLYELNLTDLDYNNQVHQFNLAMYTNSVCYDDVMNRYNSDCPYAIFVTDYTRVLTYDSESNMSLQRGAYLLSGYIDYLITDKSFFYTVIIIIDL